MIKPQPHKLKCPKCNFSKIVSPKSDVLNPLDYVQSCPKCNTMLEKTELTTVSDKIGAFLNDILR